MSNPSPYTVTVSEDGLYAKVEMDAHYVTDEQAETIRKYIKTLQDENARLRSCLSDDAENARMIMAENAKLRELAALNWEWAHSCCGNNCKMQTDGCGYGIDRECNYEREIWERMRELGVEVDDA